MTHLEFIHRFGKTLGISPEPEQLLLLKYFKEAGEYLPITTRKLFLNSWLTGDIFGDERDLVVWHLIRMEFFKEFIGTIWDSKGELIVLPLLKKGQKVKLLKNVISNVGYLLAIKGDLVTVVNDSYTDQLIVSCRERDFYVDRDDLEEAKSLRGKTVSLIKDVYTHDGLLVGVEGQEGIIKGESAGLLIFSRDIDFFVHPGSVKEI